MPDSGTTVAVGVLVAALAIGWLHRLATRRLIVVTVRGLSMLPTYSPGDRVLVRRGLGPHRGQVVVIEPAAGNRPEHASAEPWIIKRVVAVPGDRVDEDGTCAVANEVVPPGMLFLLGDNRKVSMDSRQTGFFSEHQLLGTVWCSL